MDKKIYLFCVTFSIITMLFSFCDTTLAVKTLDNKEIVNFEDQYNVYRINEEYSFLYDGEVELIVDSKNVVKDVYSLFEVDDILINQLNNKYPSNIYENIVLEYEIFIDDNGVNFKFINNSFNFDINVILLCEFNSDFKIDCNNDESLLINSFYLDPSIPTVALSFDDGPNKNTAEIIEVLKKYDVNATFFVLGMQMEYYPDILKDMYASGFEIGNHTYNHKYLTRISFSDVEYQLNKTNEIYNSLTGDDLELLRPTYGVYNSELLSRVDYTFVNWSVDSNDWRYKNASKTTQTILNSAEDGDVILLHDIQGSTADAMEDIVVGLLDKGFQIVSISELAKLKGVELETNKLYREFK